jgi:hypothetical protein
MPRKKPVPLMLRLPSDLHKRLAREADKAGRSLNQELVRRLEDSFRLRPEAIEDLTELLAAERGRQAATAICDGARQLSGRAKGVKAAAQRG